jgi:hypothetical protein
VVVDIGGDIGALVVTTPPVLEGVEIEICPVGSLTRTHTVVRARLVRGADVVYAGVFPSLPEGDYTLLAWAYLPETALRIAGGEITQISW